jgi:pre-peptidase
VTPRFTRIAVTALAVAVSLGLAPSAFAVSESGDAGDLPSTAQDLGSGAVTSILGSFPGGGDVDVYRVCLTDGASFSATTSSVGPPPLDTQLFLLDANGFGVYSNDDAAIGQRNSRLPSNHRFSPTAPGVYFIALSSFNNDPQSDAGEIFPDLFSTSLYPDMVVDAAGVGADEPIVGWSGPTRGPPGLYRITVTGTMGCDTVPPTVDLRSPADGSHVKQNVPLEVDFSCADTGGSGLASCVGSVADGALLDTSTLGDASVTVTARDHAGNQTVVTNTVTVVDETSPTVSVTTPAEGATYELGAQVLADYACADEANGSGLDSCDGSVAQGAAVDTASLGQKTFTVNASDHAGNTESKSVTYTVVDTQAPSIVVTTPAPGAVYAVGEQVAADYSCSDDGSGVASCVGSVANGAPLDTGSPGDKTFTVNATDKAGNPASKSVSYSVADGTAPSIAFTNPTQGAVYKLGQKVVAGYSCADEPNGSGVATCDGTLPVGARLDTSRVGAKTFTVRTSDNAGNGAAQTVSYSVVYDFDGFLWPLVNPPRVNRWKAGLPVPVRFSVGSYRGSAPVAAGYPKVAPVSCSGGGEAAGSEKASGSWMKRSVHGSKRGGWTYMFLWKTEKNWAGGCRQFVLKLDDGTVHRVDVQFEGRGKDHGGHGKGHGKGHGR